MESKNYEFTKLHTQIAKGVAVTLMMIHHLFAFPERIQNVTYIPMLHFWKFGVNQNTSMEYFLGNFANICVAMYIFLSGYGLYKSSLKKENFTINDSIKKMMKFLTNYWVVLILFVPIGLIFFRGDNGYHLSIVEFMANFFTLSSSYNYEWWFVRLYIELLLLFPLIKRMLTGGLVSSFAKSFGIYILAMVVVVLDIPLVESFRGNFIYEDIMDILFWQMTFCMGFIAAKFNLFNYITGQIARMKLDKKIFYIIIILVIIYSRIELSFICAIIGKGNARYGDFILAPTFILVCTNLIHGLKGENIILVLGKNSTNIWLTHTFFCYYYFQKIVFLPKLSILILIWLATLSLISSTLVNYVIKSSEVLLKGIDLSRSSKERC